MLIPTDDNVRTITDMREDALALLNEVRDKGLRYIFHHSKPKAVLMDINQFVAMQSLMEDYQDVMDAKRLSQEKRGKGIPLAKIAKDYV